MSLLPPAAFPSFPSVDQRHAWLSGAGLDTPGIHNHGGRQLHAYRIRRQHHCGGDGEGALFSGILRISLFWDRLHNSGPRFWRGDNSLCHNLKKQEKRPLAAKKCTSSIPGLWKRNAHEPLSVSPAKPSFGTSRNGLLSNKCQKKTRPLYCFFILTLLFMCDALFYCHSCSFGAGDGSFFFSFFPFFPGTSLPGSAGGISRKLFFAANLSAFSFS